MNKEFTIDLSLPTCCNKQEGCEKCTYDTIPDEVRVATDDSSLTVEAKNELVIGRKQYE